MYMDDVEGMRSSTQKARRGVRVGPRSVHINHKRTGRGRLLGAMPRQTQESRPRRVRLLSGGNQRRRRPRTYIGLARSLFLQGPKIQQIYTSSEPGIGWSAGGQHFQR